ncbi:MAG: Methyltransferase type 11 [Bacteroidota bacterium]|jgi:SAM-dependent methyltransferase|nr:Methyltransferase type 11 [Bacteroidota bacterium]
MTIRQIAAKYKNQYFYNSARRAFEKADAKHFFLDKNKFDEYVERYKIYTAASHWDYSPLGQEMIAKERIGRLLNYNNNKIPEYVCEIGPGSGLLLKQFANLGCKKIYGVDIQQPNNPDSRIEYVTDGVHEMSHIEDSSIDFMYSIDCFEHIPNPVAGLKKCLEKLKPGGIFYLQIGANYFSPWGFHYYHILKMPYPNILFPEEYLKEYAKARNISYPWTNRVPAHEYISFLEKLTPDTELLSLKYDYMWYFSRFIKKEIEVFKAKNIPNFEDYYIGEIYALIKKSETSEYMR